MDKHEYMIWRAATKYDLLHDESSGATEENVEEMIDNKEKQITKLIPNYFAGKEKLDDGSIGYVLDETIAFIAHRRDYQKWGNGELLCCLNFVECKKDAPVPAHLLSRVTGWCRYFLRSYDEVIMVLRNSIKYSDLDYNDINKVKSILIDAKIFTQNQLESACVYNECRWQTLPDDTELHPCLYVGQDYKYWKIRGDKNE